MRPLPLRALLGLRRVSCPDPPHSFHTMNASDIPVIIPRLAPAYAVEAVAAAAPLPLRALAGARLVVLACPQRRLSRAELAAVRGVVVRGGALLALAAAGGDRTAGEHSCRCCYES